MKKSLKYGTFTSLIVIKEMRISAVADFRRLGTFVPGLFCAESGPGGDGVPSSFWNVQRLEY